MKLSKNPRNVKPNIEVTFVCLREIEMKGKGRERLGEKGETRSHRMETRTRSTAVPRSVCKVRTQDPENFDEEVKSLLTAWRMLCLHLLLS